MKYSSRVFKRAFALLIVGLVASLGWTGCSQEKKHVEDEEPTAGEIEAEDESAATGETEMEPKHGWVEVEVEEEEIDIEGEFEFPGDQDSASTDEEEVDIEIGRPDPTAAKVITEIYPVPVDFIGTTVFAKARVTDVISDRGFWVKSGDEKIFAVVREDVPQKEMIDIDAGQTIRFVGLLADGDDWKALKGDLEPKTKQVLEEQRSFLAIYWSHIKIVDDDAEANTK